MKSIIVTEVSLPVKLSLMGLLNHFGNEEVRFYITDLCYRYSSRNDVRSANEGEFARRLIAKGVLKVVSLDESQMRRVGELYTVYKPKFVSRSISALVLAETTGYRLISENDLLCEIASSELSIRANNKYWCVKDLIDDIGIRGIHLDIELVNELL